jgi:hypothetical protein
VIVIISVLEISSLSVSTVVFGLGAASPCLPVLGGILMNSLPLIADASIKACCFTFKIQDGEIQAVKHCPGLPHTFYARVQEN